MINTFAYIYELILGASQLALMVKNLSANAGDKRDVGSVPGSERSPEGGHGNQHRYSCLENSMDRGAWQATVHSSVCGPLSPTSKPTTVHWILLLSSHSSYSSLVTFSWLMSPAFKDAYYFTGCIQIIQDNLPIKIRWLAILILFSTLIPFHHVF